MEAAHLRADSCCSFGSC